MREWRLFLWVLAGYVAGAAMEAVYGSHSFWLKAVVWTTATSLFGAAFASGLRENHPRRSGFICVECGRAVDPLERWQQVDGEKVRRGHRSCLDPSYFGGVA